MVKLILNKLKLKSEQIYLFGLSVFIFLLPQEIRYNNIGLILLIFGALFNFNIKDFKANFNHKFYKTLYILFALFYVYFLIRSINFFDETIVRASAVRELGRKIAFVLFPLFFNFRLISKYYKTLLSAFIYGVFFAIIICFVNALYINIQEGLSVGRGLNHFNAWYFSNHLLVKPIDFHPTVFALVTSIVLHIAVFNFLKLNSNFYLKLFKNQVFTFVVIGLLLLFMLALSSRNVLFFTGISLFVTLIYYIRKTKKYKIVILLGTFAVVLIGLELSYNHVNRKRILAVITFKTDNVNNIGAFGGSSMRLASTKALYNDIVKKHLFFGIGSGRQQSILNRAYTKHNVTIAAQEDYNAHNQYLETLIYNGVFGLLLLLCIYAFLFRYSFNNHLILGLVISYLLFTVALTESILERQKGLWLFVTLTFVFIHHTNTKHVK